MTISKLREKIEEILPELESFQLDVNQEKLTEIYIELGSGTRVRYDQVMRLSLLLETLDIQIGWDTLTSPYLVVFIKTTKRFRHG